MKRYALTLLCLSCCSSLYAADLPDPAITPGAYNPVITQENIERTVCVKGYTKTVRPPAHFANKLKKHQIRLYGYADTNPQHYEEDHLIALNIGGMADDPKNLWPKPKNSEWNAARKNDLKFKLYKMVCDRSVPLVQAQQAMRTSWIEAYKRYIGLSGFR